MPKRKYSNDDQSNMAEGHQNNRTGPVTLVIDPDGDLYMKLDFGSLKVSRKALTLSSPVFLAMLGANSKFKEATDPTLDLDGVQIVSFEEDDFDTMKIIARIMHLQSDDVPTTIAFKQLYQVAVLCDKYDLKRCLGPWTKIWATPYLDCYTRQGYEGWLFMSIVFRYDGLFKEITRHLVINSEISEQGTLVTTSGFDLSEGISSAILDRITKSRAETMFVVLDLYWQELCKLKASNTARVCKVGGVNVAKCDAINLGCLYQRLPELQDPRQLTGAHRKTVKSMTEAPAGILELSGALIFKFGDHRPCAVGSRLAIEATKLLDAVQGLELSDINGYGILLEPAKGYQSSKILHFADIVACILSYGYLFQSLWNTATIQAQRYEVRGAFDRVDVAIFSVLDSPRAFSDSLPAPPGLFLQLVSLYRSHSYCERARNIFTVLVCVDSEYISARVGGSLGGLFAAIVLKRLGHVVRIFERNPTPLLHNQGAGVVAGGDIQAFFNKHDATKRPIAVTSKLRQYLDLQGNQIHQEDTVQKMTSWDLLYYLLRANFDGVESGYCKVPEPFETDGRGAYEYGNMVKSVRDLGEHVEIEYEDKRGKVDTTTADLVIGADGPSSTLRRILIPEVKRNYAGYVAWRGTVPEQEASVGAKETFVDKFTFYHSRGTQILAYAIPGENGSLEPGERLINWVWYCNYPQDSTEYNELMTDSDGKTHRVTLPIGKMRKHILAEQRQYAQKVLPPQFAEIVCGTKQPFIQAITDVISPRNSFFDGKLLLIGDAVAGFRPHTAASTSQAAFDAQKLYELMNGEIGLGQWEEETMEFAKYMQKRGVEMGQRSQFGNHPLAQTMHGMASS